VQVFKWDGVAVKNALDDAVREVMTVRLPYLENHGLMDGRLAICAIAVATAMFALLWDFLYPFPKVSQWHRVHRVVTAAFWRTFNHEGKISPGW